LVENPKGIIPLSIYVKAIFEWMSETLAYSMKSELKCLGIGFSGRLL
jgi:hypothetical protein